jgi:hypothetical protein
MTLLVFEIATSSLIRRIRLETRDALAHDLIAPEDAGEIFIACERLDQKLKAAVGVDRAAAPHRVKTAPGVPLAPGPVGSEDQTLVLRRGR